MHSDTETSTCSDQPSDSEAVMLDAASKSDPALPSAIVHNQEQQSNIVITSSLDTNEYIKSDVIGEIFIQQHSDIVNAWYLDTNESIKSEVIGEIFIQETELPGIMEIISKSEPMRENRDCRNTQEDTTRCDR